MKTYKPEGLDGLLNRRRRLLLHYEVIAHEISISNKQIATLFFDSLNNRCVSFDRGNEVEWMSESGEIGIGMPVDMVYCIEQVQSANTYDDIIYMLRSVKGGDVFAIRQHEFHSFTFKEDIDNS